MTASNRWKRYALLVLTLASAGTLVLLGSQWSGRSSPKSRGELTLIATVSRGDIQVHVREVGIVEPSVQLEVKSALSGRVVKIRVREGDVVHRGDVLAVIEPDLGQAHVFVDLINALRTSAQALREAQRHFDADTHLYQSGILPQTVYLDSKTRVATAQEVYAAAERKVRLIRNSGIEINESDGTIQTSTVRSPVDGFVLSRGVSEGETVVTGVGPLNGGSVLFTIAGSGPMKIKAAVSELNLGKIEVGQHATVTIDSYPGLSIPAVIRWMAPAIRVEEKARVFDVELEPLTTEAPLRSGMTVNVDISGMRKEDVATLPVEAVFEKNGKQFVYRFDKSAKNAAKTAPGAKPNLFTETAVRTGLSDGSRIEVIAGVQAGDRVALEPPRRARVN